MNAVLDVSDKDLKYNDGKLCCGVLIVYVVWSRLLTGKITREEVVASIRGLSEQEDCLS